MSTNITNGLKVFVRDSNEGLYSSSADDILLGNFSTSYDLAQSGNEGYGIKNSYAVETTLGPFVALTPYNGSDDQIGGFTNASTGWEIYNSSSSPLYESRFGIEVKAKYENYSLEAASDYIDTITFTVGADM